MYPSSMGVDQGGREGQVPPEFGVGDASANCPPQIFVIIDTKRSVLWPSKYAKIQNLPRTPLGELTTLPQTL